MLRLIITPHEEESFNTSKKASKKDQCSSWLKKRNPNKPYIHSCRHLSQQYWIFPKINAGVPELDQENQRCQDELSGHCALHSGSSRTDPDGEVRHLLVLTTPSFPDFRNSTTLLQSGVKNKQAPHMPDLLQSCWWNSHHFQMDFGNYCYLIT